jgi:hypothetical protein
VQIVLRFSWFRVARPLRYFPVPLQLGHFMNPVPLQEVHFMPLLWPAPRHEMQVIELVPDPPHLLQASASANPLVASPTTVVMAAVKRRRRVILVCAFMGSFGCWANIKLVGSDSVPGAVC